MSGLRLWVPSLLVTWTSSAAWRASTQALGKLRYNHSKSCCTFQGTVLGRSVVTKVAVVEVANVVRLTRDHTEDGAIARRQEPGADLHPLRQLCTPMEAAASVLLQILQTFRPARCLCRSFLPPSFRECWHAVILMQDGIAQLWGKSGQGWYAQCRSGNTPAALVKDASWLKTFLTLLQDPPIWRVRGVLTRQERLRPELETWNCGPRDFWAWHVSNLRMCIVNRSRFMLRVTACDTGCQLLNHFPALQGRSEWHGCGFT